MANELQFQRALEMKEGVSNKDAKYMKLDLNKLVERSGSPIEIVIKVFNSK